MNENEFRLFLTEVVDRVAILNKDDQRRLIINLSHSLTVAIRGDIGKKPNMANIQMANEYLHQLLGWLQYQERGSGERFEACEAVARAWDGYIRAQHFLPGPELQGFGELISRELSRFSFNSG